MSKTLALLAALMLGSAAAAHEYTAGSIQIAHPYLPMPRGGAETAAGYMTITNTGPTADHLISVTTPAADMAMVHRSATDANGVSTMTDVPALEIPAGASVVLEPGGLHVMFMGVKTPLTEGQMLPATLTFERAGTVAVEFKVEKPGETKGHDHSAHGTTGSGG